MAWPCVTRACCIARFGNKQDKGDIAVPLMFSKYSEVTEGANLSQQPRPGSAAIETQPPLADSYYGGQSRSSRDYSRRLESTRGSVMRQDFKPWKSTPEQSCKPRSEYLPSEAPLERETQYKKDYRSWPIPRQDDHPWIPKPIQGPVYIPPVEDRKKKDLMGSILPPVEKRIIDADIAGRVAIAYNVTPEILVSVVEESKVIQQREKLTSANPVSKEAANMLQSQGIEGCGARSSYRNEFRAWTDVKPVKPIKARPQYRPPEEKVVHETSYKATFKGECNQPSAADNKLTERRRIRSLYSEPHKESSKVEKPNVQPSKPKKTTTPSHKPVKKAKDKQITPGRASKKKAPETTSSTTAKPEDKEKSKEMNNKLAEAKEAVTALLVEAQPMAKE
ncbi:microtubule-associated protein 6 isoform X3 [Eleutherodactylus coqui]|uniref:microtubule-associated protein 6 isoform X3 n=2 Tax=Eleutherodactylus coqui TaxID=57060 RepID=UPI003462D92D